MLPPHQESKTVAAKERTMSEMMAQVIERASTDAAFRAHLQRDPEAALAAYALTAEEKAALLSGDQSVLHPLGVDARVTKFGDTGSTADDSSWPNTSFD
jgi:hypothetical protein